MGIEELKCIINTEGKRDLPKKLKWIIFINRILLITIVAIPISIYGIFLLQVFYPTLIHDVLIEEKLINYIMNALVTLKLIYWIAKEYQFSILAMSLNPNYVRYCIHRELKKRPPVGIKEKKLEAEGYKILLLLWYSVLTYKKEDTELILEVLRRKRNIRGKEISVLLTRKWLTGLLFRYQIICNVYYCSMFDITSILELEQELEKVEISEKAKQRIKKNVLGTIYLFRGDAISKQKQLEIYNKHKMDIYLFYICITNCVNNEVEEFEENKRIILQGDKETFYYKIMNTHTFEELCAKIKGAKSKVDQSYWVINKEASKE